MTDIRYKKVLRAHRRWEKARDRVLNCNRKALAAQVTLDRTYNDLRAAAVELLPREMTDD